MISTSVSPLPFDRPQPHKLPILESIPLLMKRPSHALSKAQQKHGDIFTIDLGVSKIIALSHPRHVQHVLVDKATNYFFSRHFGFLQQDSSALAAAFQKEMMEPYRHAKIMTKLFNLMQVALDEELKQWPTAETPLELPTAINRLTLRLIVRALFGENFAQDEFERLLSVMRYATGYLKTGLLSHALLPALSLPDSRRYVDVLQTFDEIMFQAIHENRQNRQADSLLAEFEAMSDSPLSTKQIRHVFADVFVAGFEVTAVALTYALSEIARDNRLQEWLAIEIGVTLENDVPNLSALNQLGLVKRTLMEAIRMRPSLWFVPFKAVEDDFIDGYPISAGSHAALLMHQIYHHPQFWSDPNRFNPDRFNAFEQEPKHPAAFMPFGLPEQQALHQEFAFMAGHLILVRLLQTYQLSPVSKRRSTLNLSARPTSRKKILLTPRL